MPFVLAIAIIIASIVAITYKTYMGYGEYSWYSKAGFLLFLLISFFAPLFSHLIKQQTTWGATGINKFLYFLFGFIFILFIITLLRDIVWMIIDVIQKHSIDNMKNPALLQKINIITFICCLLVCIYGYYQAEKDAEIVSYDIASEKIKKPTKIVVLSDLHIDMDVPPKYLENLVNRVNGLNPDAVLIVGDLVDNVPSNLKPQLEELKKIKAEVYFVLGNHEYYVGPLGWGINLSQMGFQWLGNTGRKFKDTGIYIAGVHDINSTENIKVAIALARADYDDFVIMMSHTPKIAEGITKDNVDLQISAHTHGGQIYPFHYLVKQANDGHLAGFYDEKGVKLYVTRGTRYWGPPMRLLAPSEITVFNFKPKAENGK